MGEYYAAARLDYLVRKEEIIGVKAIETYSDRPDFLIYRSATYGPMPPGQDGVRFPCAQNGTRGILHARMAMLLHVKEQPVSRHVG